MPSGYALRRNARVPSKPPGTSSLMVICLRKNGRFELPHVQVHTLSACTSHECLVECQCCCTQDVSCTETMMSCPPTERVKRRSATRGDGESRSSGKAPTCATTALRRFARPRPSPESPTCAFPRLRCPRRRRHYLRAGCRCASGSVESIRQSERINCLTHPLKSDEHSRRIRLLYGQQPP